MVTFKQVLVFGDNFFYINDIVVIVRRNDTDLIGKLINFEYYEDKLKIDVSRNYTSKIEEIPLEQIESITAV